MSCDMIWLDICYDVTQRDVIWFAVWCDMTWYDLIWYDMIIISYLLSFMSSFARLSVSTFVLSGRLYNSQIVHIFNLSIYLSLSLCLPISLYLCMYICIYLHLCVYLSSLPLTSCRCLGGFESLYSYCHCAGWYLRFNNETIYKGGGS